jgi:hypothetical protein
MLNFNLLADVSPTWQWVHAALRQLNFDFLRDVPPAAAKGIFLGLFIVSGLLVLMIPKKSIYEGVEDPRWWHNLKLWALGVLTIIFTIYVIF